MLRRGVRVLGLRLRHAVSATPAAHGDAVPLASLPVEASDTLLSVKTALHRAPFIIFSKDVPPPTKLPYYDPTKDFTYHYCNDTMSLWSGLTPAELTSSLNAANVFPNSFHRFFEDDIDVCLNFHFPLTKSIVEAWQPPMMETFVHMRKTLFNHGERRWVVGCGAPFDDIEIGLASFRASRLPTPGLLPQVPDAFFDLLWAELPQACFALASIESPMVVAANEFAHTLLHESELEMVNWSRDQGCPWDDDKRCMASMGDSPITKVIASCLEKVRANSNAECWQFGSVRLGDQLMRVWVWRPLITEPTLIFSLRPHLETVPDEIKSKLLVSRSEQPESTAEPHARAP